MMKILEGWSRNISLLPHIVKSDNNNSYGHLENPHTDISEDRITQHRDLIINSNKIFQTVVWFMNVVVVVGAKIYVAYFDSFRNNSSTNFFFPY